jgi:hypothetical protein
MILVQNRNRRTGKRRTLQIAEVLPNGDPHVLMRLNVQEDEIEKVAESETVMDKLELYTGMTREQLEFDLKQKQKILKWMARNDIENVHEIGKRMAQYYMGTLRLD